jgi:hypothetical protein
VFKVFNGAKDKGNTAIIFIVDMFPIDGLFNIFKLNGEIRFKLFLLSKVTFIGGI